MNDRRILPQSLFLDEGTTISKRVFNKRKLRELPHALIRIQDWDNFKNWTINLPFIVGRFMSNQGHECVSDLLEASRLCRSIQIYYRFVGSNVIHLLRDPECAYQLASQHGSKMIRDLLEKENFSFSDNRNILKDINPQSIDDPCLLTLQGHNGGIRCCEFSDDGSLIVSVSSDGDHGCIKIWDTSSGQEAMSLTNLSGPPFPGLVDDFHGEQCCIFVGPSSVAVGCDDGHLEIFSKTGLKVELFVYISTSFIHVEINRFIQKEFIQMPFVV